MSQGKWNHLRFRANDVLMLVDKMAALLADKMDVVLADKMAAPLVDKMAAMLVDEHSRPPVRSKR
jgi:hypothetical protein